MLISASRRTDIPAYYSEWFFNRIREKYVLVRNPMNHHRVSRISLTPDVVDGIVFWTKNPLPMLNRLNELKDYMYYFQFTLTPYGSDVEPGIPSKQDVLVPAFQHLSETLGPGRVIWRYDPVFLSNMYTEQYHYENFEKLAEQLCRHTKKCTFSFLDLYKNTRRNASALGIIPLSDEKMIRMAKKFARIAGQYDFTLDACAENTDFTPLGIRPARCVDAQLFERLLGCRLNTAKDKNQRPECSCDASIDIGLYNTCPGGCKYCYANYNAGTVSGNKSKHKPDSPLICGELTDADIIRDRTTASLKDHQLRIFDG